MKALIKRMISLFLAISCFCMCFFPVHAKEDDGIPWVIPGEPNKPAIGGEDDGLGSMHAMFSITANRVCSLLVSSLSNKYFTLSSLPADAEELICVANLDHSLRTVPDIGGALDGGIIFGIAYCKEISAYGEAYYEHVYIASYSWDEIGNTKTVAFTIDSRLKPDVEYYLYIYNYYGSGDEDDDTCADGYVFGTLSLYYR